MRKEEAEKGEPNKVRTKRVSKPSYSDCSNHHSTGQNWSCEEYGREAAYGFGNYFKMRGWFVMYGILYFAGLNRLESSYLVKSS